MRRNESQIPHNHEYLKISNNKKLRLTAFDTWYLSRLSIWKIYNFFILSFAISHLCLIYLFMREATVVYTCNALY